MEQKSEQKILYSGIQPSGNVTLGNYFGAISNWVKLQDEYDCLFNIADLHSITVTQDPKQLRARSLELLALLIAAGISPEKNILFIQSHVAEHSQLAWVLDCFTQFGELSRMTQFKDKSAKNAQNINAGLFTYPTLMAADILLYQTDVVPVGVDQKQHLEIARDIAGRFNSIYGEVFAVPEAYIPKVGAKIMSLTDPTKKMSKSDENPNGYITLLDDPDTIVRKFKRATTDSEAEVVYREGKDGVNNLLTIFSLSTGRSVEEIQNEFSGKGYGDLKMAVAESVVEKLRPLQAKYHDLMNNRDYLKQIYTDGAQKAQRRAIRTLSKVYKKVGFVAR